MSNTEEFTIGVEEEYQIINKQTRELHSRQERIRTIETLQTSLSALRF